MDNSFNERLAEWEAGDLDDDELTDEEILELERRVLAAIATKTLVREGVHTFPEHKTIQ